MTDGRRVDRVAQHVYTFINNTNWENAGVLLNIKLIAITDNFERVYVRTVEFARQHAPPRRRRLLAAVFV